jgi:hypothetical protein
VQLESQHDAVAIRAQLRISEGAVSVLDVPSVQLKNESLTDHEALIFVAPVSARATKQISIPSAHRRDVVNADERRKLHAEAPIFA